MKCHVCKTGDVEVLSGFKNLKGEAVACSNPSCDFFVALESQSPKVEFKLSREVIKTLLENLDTFYAQDGTTDGEGHKFRILTAPKQGDRDEKGKKKSFYLDIDFKSDLKRNKL